LFELNAIISKAFGAEKTNGSLKIFHGNSPRRLLRKPEQGKSEKERKTYY